jgi:hypothetical protein
MMHKNDDTLGKLDAEKAAGKDVDQEIKKREKLLLPMYKQVATSYCDLHDRSGRMKGLGAIHEELEWKKSRTYLHWRIRRRQRENQACKDLRRKVPEISQAEAAKIVAEKVAAALGATPSDQAVAEWLEANGNLVASFIEEQRLKAAESQIFALFGSLPAEKQADIARDLMGFTRVMRSK